MTHLVFVYGTLRRGEGNDYLLQGSAYVGAAGSVGTYYTLAQSGAVPFLWQCKHKTAYCGQVLGELWAVDDKTLARLDRLEGHPTFYRRERRKFLLASGEVTAWVYLCRRHGIANILPVAGKVAAERWGEPETWDDWGETNT